MLGLLCLALTFAHFEGKKGILKACRLSTLATEYILGTPAELHETRMSNQVTKAETMECKFLKMISDL